MKLFIITLNTSRGREEFLQYGPDIATVLIAQINLGFSVHAIAEAPADAERMGFPWLVEQDYGRLKDPPQ